MPRAPEGTIVATHIWKRFRADQRRAPLLEGVTALKARMTGRNLNRYRWALRDVELRAQPGESVALVGANGSGKSTLLKILTRVMYPSAGTVEVVGRVGALIEVSSGIHPQLTARENIYLYGSLLGLSRQQVRQRFDAIVDFAEVETAVDRMVKHYSSGMKMRLGFAVAAFLEPDILLVDEVLAVGDASFQQRCLDRMRVVLDGGTTLVFVSHDLAAVQATCQRGLWLNDGVEQIEGPVDDVLTAYRRSIEEAAEGGPATNGLVALKKMEVTGPDGGVPRTNETLEITAVVQSPQRRSGYLAVGVSEGPATPIFSVRRTLDLVEGETEVRCSISHLPLPKGRFYVWLSIQENVPRVARRRKHALDIVPWHPVAQFDVVGPGLDPMPTAVVRLAPVHVDAAWDVAHR